MRCLEITNEAVCYLVEADYHWPGNVRQAELLGVSESKFYKMLRRFDLS
jgi:transcriptional regulator of acetoin/glycerol metabolism